MKMNALRVHRVNFFTPEPTAIHSLAYDESVSRLAVSRILLPSDQNSIEPIEQGIPRNSRVDSSIEIWDVQKTPFLEKKIPSAFNNSVEVIAWCAGRLFTVNMHGTINEYDLKSLKSKYNITVASGCPLYCISVNKQKTFIATGNEDGHVVLYQVTTYGVEYEKKFDKQEGRILCLDWHESGEIIVTGSIDTIRVWNVLTGRVIVRIIVGRENRSKETFVWCLAITSDMTIISGDSRGKTSFWDANTGTLLSSIGAHKADVFALTLSKDENTVYTSGVDPLIIMFIRSEIESSSNTEARRKWMKSVQRLEHTHDVRALQLVGEYLVSGGIDCNLVFSKFPPKTIIRFFPFTQIPYCSVASDAAYILLRYPRFVEIWKLGKSSSNASVDGEQLPLDELPQKLMKFSSNDDEIIICSSISADGKWIAYSSLEKLRLFYVENKDDSCVPVLHKVAIPVFPTVAYNLLFASSEAKLIVYDKNAICVIKCDRVQSELLASFEQDSDGHLFELSPNDVYLACGYHNGKVLIYNLHTLKLFCELPQYKFQPTAFKFDKTSENIVVVYSDRKIIEYDLKEQKYSNWSRSNSFSEFQQRSLYPVTNIILHKNKILLQDESIICVIEKSDQTLPKKKRTKKENESVAEEKDCKKASLVKVVDRYEHISSIHSILDDLIVIEISPIEILNALPPPLQRKKYGT